MQECFIRTSLAREALILLVSIPDGIKEVNSRASQHSIPPTGPGWVTPRFQAQWCEQTSVASHQCFLSNFVHYITQSNKACCSKLPFDCCHTQPHCTVRQPRRCRCRCCRRCCCRSRAAWACRRLVRCTRALPAVCCASLYRLLYLQYGVGHGRGVSDRAS